MLLSIVLLLSNQQILCNKTEAGRIFIVSSGRRCTYIQFNSIQCATKSYRQRFKSLCSLNKDCFSTIYQLTIFFSVQYALSSSADEHNWIRPCFRGFLTCVTHMCNQINYQMMKAAPWFQPTTVKDNFKASDCICCRAPRYPKDFVIELKHFRLTPFLSANMSNMNTTSGCFWVQSCWEG